MNYDKVNRLFVEIQNCTILEMSTLTTQLETLFESTAINTETNTNIITNEKNSEDSEKPTFNLILKNLPSDKKIPVLKVIRTITGLGLKESKVIVDTVPQIVKENLLQDEALKFQKELEAAGAEIVIEPIKK